MREEQVIEIFMEVYEGDRKVFPKHFWSGDKEIGKERMKIIVNYILNEILEIEESEIVNVINKKFLDTYKLRGGFTKLFKSDMYEIVEYIHGNKYREWEMKTVRRNYWSTDNILTAAKEIIINDLEYKTFEDFAAKITREELDSTHINKILAAIERNIHDVYTISKLVYGKKDVKKEDFKVFFKKTRKAS